MSGTFDELVAEGAAEPVEGWDFSWFAGRATEERPSWGYAGLLAGRLGRVSAALDLQTGGGEVYAEALGRADRAPATVAATESWPPNLGIAREHLRPFGGTVAEVAENAGLPFGDGSFELVSSRHPTALRWDEIARTLRPGGTFLCQGVDSHSNRELSEAMLGPVPDDPEPRAHLAAAAAERAGLEVADLRRQRLRAEFHDIGAVVYFLRKVLWTVPGFTVERYRDELAVMHERIEADGAFVSHATRFLIEARKPG